MQNQLLAAPVEFYDFEYSALTASDFVEAFTVLMPQVQQEHDLRQSGPLTYSALFEHDTASRKLGRAMNLLGHLHATVCTPELREVYQEYMPQLSQLLHEMSTDLAAYNHLVKFIESENFASLDEVKKRVALKTKEAYERSGVHLSDIDKDRLGELAMREAELAQQFDMNLMDFDERAVLRFSPDALKGVPVRTLRNASVVEDGSYEVSKLSGAFSDISIACDIEETRKVIYEYELNRGVAEGLDNRPILQELIAIVQERAKLLGFNSHAEYAMQDNMVKNPAAAIAFSTNLARKSHAQAVRDSDALMEFGTKLLGHAPAFHDIGYVYEKMRNAAYSIDFSRIREYFPASRVVPGMLNLLSTVFGLRFERNTQAHVWHPDVEVYDVIDLSSGDKRGVWYLDLYMRANKEEGAWMRPMSSRHVGSGFNCEPVAVIVDNIARSSSTAPVFEFGEIIGLLHEMGHALHHVLTDVTEEFFSGTNHVPEDAVELPSQFMENFCWDYEVLKALSSHVETGEVLPVQVFENLTRSRYFMAATHLLRGARLALIDMRLFSETNRAPEEIEQDVYSKFRIRDRDPRDSALPGFSHIFTGGYGAAYYAYQWAEMYSADAFEVLQQQGKTYLEQREAAERFRKEILATGGFSDMGENYMRFKGSAPDVSALLRSYGLKA